MSCFIVPDYHIDALVSWAIDRNIPTSGYSKASLALMLAGANRLAYQERYQDPGVPSAYPGFRRVDVSHLDPVDIVKACDCLDYQASDWGMWRESGTCQALGTIRQAAYRLASGGHQVEAHRLPGYDAATWCLDNEEATT